MGKHLTSQQIDNSQEIQSWLKQFSDSDYNTVIEILKHLLFVSRDEFADYLIKQLFSYSQQINIAIYSVRKFEDIEELEGIKCLWDDEGKTLLRPAHALGSEDFIASIIANANRQYGNCFLDNPDLLTLKKKKVHDIILIDDSIGSGNRITDFINRMTAHKSFMSWWSGGFIKFHIISYSCTYQAQNFIIRKIHGSNHGIRKYPIANKLLFKNKIIFDAYNMHYRWGKKCDSILNLCSSTKKIKTRFRKGVGDIMSNIVFYHSVPNNIPGILFYRSRKWEPLFLGRSLPKWMIELLDNNTQSEQNETSINRDELFEILKLIKRGIRTPVTLSRKIDKNVEHIQKLLDYAIEQDLILITNRITQAGDDYIKSSKEMNVKNRKYNYSLYVPKSWCAG